MLRLAPFGSFTPFGIFDELPNRPVQGAASIRSTPCKSIFQAYAAAMRNTVAGMAEKMVLYWLALS